MAAEGPAADGGGASGAVLPDREGSSCELITISCLRGSHSKSTCSSGRERRRLCWKDSVDAELRSQSSPGAGDPYSPAGAWQDGCSPPRAGSCGGASPQPACGSAAGDADAALAPAASQFEGVQGGAVNIAHALGATGDVPGCCADEWSPLRLANVDDRRSSPSQVDHLDILGGFQQGLASVESVVIYDHESSDSEAEREFAAFGGHGQRGLSGHIAALGRACFSICSCRHHVGGAVRRLLGGAPPPALPFTPPPWGRRESKETALPPDGPHEL